MGLSKIVTAYITVYMLAQTCSLLADCGENYFDVGTGYKWGNFTRDVDVILLEDSSSRSLTIDFNDLQFVTLDARTKFFLTNSLYFRADGEYGWMVGGDARRSIDAPPLVASLDGSFHTEGHIANLHGAFGYTFYPSCLWNFAPVVGLGYDNQSISSHPSSAPSSPTIFSNKLSWIGPWVGVDISFSPACCFHLDLEYAYHFVKYRDYHVDVPFGAAFIDFVYNNARGNTVLLNGTYTFCNGWRLGVGFTFEDWQSGGNPQVDAIALAPFPLDLEDENDHYWAYGLQVKIGRNF